MDGVDAKIIDVKADDRCANCHADFADHNYDAERDLYVCPHPHQETGYGGFKGGDPRMFRPDHEACSPEQIAAWRAACDKFNKAIFRGETPEDGALQPCRLNGVSGAGWRFGIGVYTIEYEQTWEAQ